jgi:hypothetical protein
MSDTTPADVIAFIVARADETDLANILNAVKARRKALGQINASAVKVGATVTLDGLSPKYLNGLTGTVKSVSGGRCTVTLDEASTNDLGFRSTRFYVLPGSKTYDLAGIPTQCAKVRG